MAYQTKQFYESRCFDYCSSGNYNNFSYGKFGYPYANKPNFIKYDDKVDYSVM